MSSEWSRRDFLIGSGALLSAATFGLSCGGPYVRERALPSRPEVPPGEAPIVTALRYGISAPSAHNTQPWLFELVSATEARLYTDPERLLPLTDPPARQVHISHGTLLETVSIAATALGYRAEVTLLPQGAVTAATYGVRPTAAIGLVEAPEAARDPLFAAIAARRTSRLVHDGPAPDGADLHAVRDAATRPGVDAEVQTEALAPRLALLSRAMAVEVHDAVRYGETRDWFRFSADEVAAHGDGLNLQTAGADTLGARLFLSADNFQSEANQSRYLTRFDEALASTQALLVLRTEDNTMRDWIETGRAYVRGQLAAAARDLFLHPVSQVLQEFPEMDALRAEAETLFPVAAPGKCQMIVRLGRTAPPAVSPRRPLEAVVRG